MSASIRLRRALAVASVATTLLVGAAHIGARLQTDTSFASRIAELSEPAGYFDTDNLISNERSYLHVVPALEASGLRGGAYVGVGPDQNFSYIAHVRPSVAFIIDIRRENLLLHLLFKALFELSQTRIEYLAQLHGRPVPQQPERFSKVAIDRLVAYVDRTKPDEKSTDALRVRVDATLARYGVPLSQQDLETIDRFHRTFIDAGLSLRFQSSGRAPRSYYPTYRDLFLETDRQGRRSNFLASETDYGFVRSLEARDLVIPVVGDLGGKSALAAIGRLMEQRGDKLSAFYASNVEFYLFGQGTFSHFVENLNRLPRTGQSLIIRSVFGGYALLDSAPGYYSASQVQTVEQLIEGVSLGRYRHYRELVEER